MALINGRLIVWFIKELTDKYTKFFFGGVILGAIIMLVSTKVFHMTFANAFQPTKRIGIVGDFSVSNLPDSILENISDGLTQLAPDGSVLPALASSWEATDSGKTYIFHLQEGIVWHDGKPVTSKDINYNIKNVSLETPDPYTIIFHIDMQYSPFPTVVSKPIVKKGLIGTGIYRVSKIRMKAGVFSSLTLKPEGKKLPTITYIFYKTDQQAITAYSLGEINELHGLADVPNDMMTWKNTTVSSATDSGQIVSLFFNVQNDLLKEKTLRQALAYAVPIELENRAYSPIPLHSWAYTDSVKKYDFDMKQAQKLFDQTKLGTESASLTLHTFTPYMDIANSIAEKWTELGIRTDVKVENSLPSDYQVLLTSRQLPKDPDQYAYWHSTQTKTNVCGYVNVKIDKLLEDGRIELDQEKRKLLYVEFQKRLVDDAPAVFLFYPTLYSIERK